MKLGKIMAEYRAKRGWSYQEFAEAAGISKGYVFLLEKGSHPQTGKPIVCSVETLGKIARGMQMKLHELLLLVEDDFLGTNKDGKSEHQKNYFPERVKARREELQMTQEELARLVGCRSAVAIQKIEDGKRDVSQSKIPVFAEALITTPDYLMGWTPCAENTSQVLSEEELNLVDTYRQLTEPNKQAVAGVANNSLNAQQSKAQSQYSHA